MHIKTNSSEYLKEKKYAKKIIKKWGTMAYNIKIRGLSKKCSFPLTNQKWNVTDPHLCPRYVKASELSAFLLSACTKKQSKTLSLCQSNFSDVRCHSYGFFNFSLSILKIFT